MERTCLENERFDENGHLDAEGVVAFIVFAPVLPEDGDLVELCRVVVAAAVNRDPGVASLGKLALQRLKGPNSKASTESKDITSLMYLKVAVL